LTGTGIGGIAAFAYFNPNHSSGGQFLVLNWGGQAIVTDFAGDLISSFDCRDALGLNAIYDLCSIDGGPQGETFAVAGGNTEVVVFRLQGLDTSARALESRSRGTGRGQRKARVFVEPE
jgi:hypothetical protein